MQTNEVSFVPNAGGLSQKIATSTVSAQTTAFGTATSTSNNQLASPVDGTYVNVYSDSLAFMRQGLNPIAVNTGVDQIVPANQLFRVGPIPPGFKLAFILPAATGNVYVTPEN